MVPELLGDDGKCKDQQWRREGDGKADAERDDEAMDYLLVPSLLIVAGLTLGVAIATATTVATIRIKQFRAISLAGKVVAGACMMALPHVFFIVRGGHTQARAGQREESPAGTIAHLHRLCDLLRLSFSKACQSSATSTETAPQERSMDARNK